MRELMPSENRDLAIKICELLDSKKAENIELFGVGHLSSLADYFIMSTVSNTVQAKTLADFIEESLSKFSIKTLRRDGVSDWIILDYNFVIVHIFTPQMRESYHLEKLWNDGKNVYTLSGIKKLLEKEEKTEKQKTEKAEKLEKDLAEKEQKVKQKEEKKNQKQEIKTISVKEKVSADNKKDLLQKESKDKKELIQKESKDKKDLVKKESDDKKDLVKKEKTEKQKTEQAEKVKKESVEKEKKVKEKTSKK